MLRKLLLVTVAAVSLSTATLAPTPASAWHGGWRGGWGWGGGWGPGWGVGWGPGWRAGWGPGWGDLAGDGDAGAVGVGAGRVSLSWHRDSTEEAASFGGSSPAPGVHAGFW